MAEYPKSAESHQSQERTDPAAIFGERIEALRRDGVYAQDLGRMLPWAEATEAHKVAAITWAALSTSINGPDVTGANTLDAIERNVDYAGLPAWQRDMLLEVRAKVDDGRLDGQHVGGRMDRTWKALDRIVGVEKFDRSLEGYKADGLYDLPKNTPWAEVPEAEKVSALIGLARHDGPPGSHVLAAIEREVDYGKLPVWRRTPLEELRLRLDAGQLDGDHPRDLQDRANYALRLVEFEARIEDYKHLGGIDDWGVYHRWPEFIEEQKLDKIVRENGNLGLHFEPREFEIFDRDVDLTRVPEGRRRGIENTREMLRIGPEEYERQRQEKYAPPNEAAAAFKERIEEGLWKTCFTDGATIFADWSDLAAEVKLHALAAAMDWEQVPEAFFRTMVERELKVDDLPAEKRAALENPRENRGIFSKGFEAENGAAARPDWAEQPIADATPNLVESILLDARPSERGGPLNGLAIARADQAPAKADEGRISLRDLKHESQERESRGEHQKSKSRDIER